MVIGDFKESVRGTKTNEVSRGGKMEIRGCQQMVYKSWFFFSLFLKRILLRSRRAIYWIATQGLELK